MAEYEVLVVDTSVPEIRAPGAGDTYGFPRAISSTVDIQRGTITTAENTFNLAATWNGNVTFTGIKLDVTDTLSGVASRLLRFNVDAGSVFSIHSDGAVEAGNASAAHLFNGSVQVGSLLVADFGGNYTKNIIAGNHTSGGETNYATHTHCAGSITGFSGDTNFLAGWFFTPNVSTQGSSDTIADVATVIIDEPAITVNTGDTVTNASSLLITGAPTEGVNNYAILVDSGDINLASGSLLYNGTAIVQGDPNFVSESAPGTTPVANGTDGIAVGDGAICDSNNGIAIGVAADAGQSGQAAVETDAIAIGNLAGAYQERGVAIGYQARAGIDSDSLRPYSIAIGGTAYAPCAYGIAIGGNSTQDSAANAKEDYGIAIGANADAGQSNGGTTETDAIAIGNAAKAYETSTVAIGDGAVAGQAATSVDPDAIAIGRAALANQEAAISIGADSDANGTSSIAIGDTAQTGTGQSGVIIGPSAGSASATGINNVGIGNTVFFELTSGASNTAVGDAAGANISTGSNNIAIGQYALGSGTATVLTGNHNVAIGTGAMTDNDNGENNIGIGQNACSNMSTGTAHNNIGIGLNSMGAGTATVVTGETNIGIGRNALNDISTSYFNTVVGMDAGPIITSGHSNTCIGAAAGSSISTLNQNTCLGETSNSTATGGVAVGADSLVGGNHCVAIGMFADASGLNSIAIGGASTDANSADASANYAIAIGYNSLASAASAVAIGPNVENSTTNTVVIGYDNTNKFTFDSGGIDIPAGMEFSVNGTALASYNITDNSDANWLTVSSAEDCTFVGHILPSVDASKDLGASGTEWNNVYCETLQETSTIRVKEGVENLHYGLDTVRAMRPVSYTRKGKTETQIGLIAEEINQLIPEVVKYDDDGNPSSMNYGRLVAVLVNAIQELDAKWQS